ncbi:MAG TPA: YtcA family lipoprotein [Myxococcota bacterium]|nr:YtcA family lipoprotein [Myxococcota bacterium]
MKPWACGAGMLLVGCNAAPSISFVGSFFPAWILCAVIGGALAGLAHVALVRAGIDQFLAPRGLAYASLALSFALGTWLLFFGA